MANNNSGKKFFLRLCFGVVAAAVFNFFIFWLAGKLSLQDFFARRDQIIFKFIDGFRTDFSDKFFSFITHFGNWQIVIFFAFAFVVFLFFSKRRHYLLAFLFSAGGGEVFVWLMKHLTERARPALGDGLPGADFLSFPSGHAFIALSFYGFLAYLAFQHYKNKSLKILFALGGFFAVAAIGFSRIYLKLHWPSDVLASYFFGFIWIIPIILSLGKLKKEKNNEKK